MRYVAFRGVFPQGPIVQVAASADGDATDAGRTWVQEQLNTDLRAHPLTAGEETLIALAENGSRRVDEVTRIRGALSVWLTMALDGRLTESPTEDDLFALRDWVDERACEGDPPEPEKWAALPTVC